MDYDYNESEDEAILSAAELRIELVAKNNSHLFDKYIEYRVRGREPAVCLRMTFGDAYIKDGQAISRVYGIEANPYFIRKFADRLTEIDFKTLWNPKEAVHLLLTIAHGLNVKDQARLNAITQLNVLTGITMVDGTGNTRATRGLDDFYNDNGAPQISAPAYQDIQSDTTKH